MIFKAFAGSCCLRKKAVSSVRKMHRNPFVNKNGGVLIETFQNFECKQVMQPNQQVGLNSNPDRIPI